MINPFLVKFCKIIDEAPLKNTSKSFNKSRLKRLTDIVHKDMNYILENSVITYDILQNKNIKFSTQRAFVSTILTLFKYVKKLKRIIPESYKSWKNISNILKKKKK